MFLLASWHIWIQFHFAFLFSVSTVHKGQWHQQQHPWTDLVSTTVEAAGKGSPKLQQRRKWCRPQDRSETGASKSAWPGGVPLLQLLCHTPEGKRKSVSGSNQPLSSTQTEKIRFEQSTSHTCAQSQTCKDITILCFILFLKKLHLATHRLKLNMEGFFFNQVCLLLKPDLQHESKHTRRDTQLENNNTWICLNQ